MKVDIISRHIIKPSSPTPHHLRTFKLSLLDQLSPPGYGPSFLFFYPSDNTKISDKSQRLQNSLSEILTRFYPAAGRLKDAASIDCNDEGAFFLEAQIDGKLSDLLEQPDAEFLDQLTDIKTIESAPGCLLLAQLNIFDCGGTALGICFSHTLVDASSLLTFLRSWANMARESDEALFPEFTGQSLLPAREMPALPSARNSPPPEKCMKRRFLFDGSKIAGLKAKLAIGQHHPTRVESVLAVILRCAIAASQSKLGSARPSLLLQAVNLRNRMIPPLPENTMGNIIWAAPVVVEANQTELHELAGKMRKGLTDLCNDKVNKFRGDEGVSAIFEDLKEREELIQSKKGMEIYISSSLCGFPLYDTADFGWGKPMWMTCARLQLGNLIMLTNTKRGNGIEAWVTLDKEKMAIFESNKELREFASINPSALI